MSDADKLIDTLKALGILIVALMALAIIVGIASPEQDVNITEKIVNKETVHLHKVMNSAPDYYIYTDSYCFNLDLKDYNSLEVGDSVNLTVKNGTNIATLILEEGKYYNV